MQYLTLQVSAALAGLSDDVHFDDVTVAAPWVDFLEKHGTPLPPLYPACGALGKFRVLKTHSPAGMFDDHVAAALRASNKTNDHGKGNNNNESHSLQEPRYIVVLRDPAAFASSLLNFLFEAFAEDTGNGTRADAEIDAALVHLVARHRVLGFPLPGVDGEAELTASGWVRHAADWTRPARKRVLVLFYEDVVADLSGTVRRVAAFAESHSGVQGRSRCGVAERATNNGTANALQLLDDDTVSRISSRCSRDNMAGNPRFACGVEAELLGFEPGKMSKALVASGKHKRFQGSGMGDEERELLREQMRREWGVDSYSELRQLLNTEQRELHGF